MENNELDLEEKTSLYKTEQETRENYDSYMGVYSENAEKISDNTVKFYLTATGNPVDFPASQKLKVTFNKIRNRYWENGEEVIIELVKDIYKILKDRKEQIGTFFCITLKNMEKI